MSELNPQGLVIYKSSAGSGKTFTLVLEYLKIVISSPQAYRHILAITFTNKATEEMKNRIIGTLDTLATEKVSKLQNDPVYQSLRTYLDSIGQADTSISSRARKVLLAILNDYSNFSVATIDSFFQRVLRAFTYELNIPLGYEVEMDQDLVLSRITDQLFTDVGADEKLTKLMLGYLHSNLEDEKTWNIDMTVQDLGKQVFQENFQRLIGSRHEAYQSLDFLEVASELWKYRKAFESRMAELGNKGEAILEAYGLDPSDFFYGYRGPAAYFSKIQNPVKVKDYEPNSYVLKAYDDPEKWVPKSKKGERKGLAEAAVKSGLDQALKQTITYYQSQYPLYVSARQFLATIYSFGVLDDLQDKLIEYRQENNQLIISDTNFLLQSVIHDPDRPLGANTPFIYEKVGTRYHYFLLDEFQDTSDMQWANLFPLVAESLASGSQGLRVGIMGDVKQSIYRWRNGNMKLLLSEVEQQVASNLNQEAQVVPLRYNWRTSSEIVGFNNLFFQLASEKLSAIFPESDSLFTEAYLGVEQIPRRTKFSGKVELRFFSPKSEEGKNWKEHALDQTYSWILNCFEEGFLGKDITLLVRRNAEGVMVAEYLQEKGVKVVSAESLLIDNHPKVRFLEHLLRYIIQSEESLTLASINYYYALLHKEEPRHQLFHDQTPSWEERLNSTLSDLRKLPVYEVLEQLIRIYPELLMPDAYVQGFADAVWEYSSQHDASILSFLDWWDEQRHKRAIASAPESQAVRIMTIHKSKGLEFPVVIMPFADWDLAPNRKDIIWTQPPSLAPFNQFTHVPLHPGSQLQDSLFASAYHEEKTLSYLDSLNLLYVAFTRPKYRLLVASARQEKFKGEYNRIYQLLSDLVKESEMGELGKLSKDMSIFSVEADLTKGLPEKDSGFSEDGIVLQRPEKWLSDWNEIVTVRYQANRYISAKVRERYQKISAGELIHEALAFVKYEDNVEWAIEKLLLKGLIDNSKVDYIREVLHRVITFKEAAAWFQKSWEVRNEAEIISPDGAIMRPDRIMISGTRAWVVDYKTGKTNPKYKDQIIRYMSALKAIGYQEVEGYLYYISLGQIDRYLDEEIRM